jgi:hypothetical protein
MREGCRGRQDVGGGSRNGRITRSGTVLNGSEPNAATT